MANFAEALLILTLVVLLAFGILVNQIVNLISYLLAKFIKEIIRSTKTAFELLKTPRTFP